MSQEKNSPEQASLEDIIDINEWQKIQDRFSSLTGIGVRVLNPEGKPLTSPSGEPRLCTQLLKNSQFKDRLCGLCLPTFLGGRGVVNKNLNFSCEAGLCNFIVPLRLNQEKALGYVIAGPVILVMRKEKKEYQRIAEEFNLSLEDFWSALLEIKIVSFHGMQSLVGLIKDIVEHTINLDYKNLMKEREVVMSSDLFKLSRLLDALLDVAFEVSQADIGSLMFLDEARENLTIRASKCIPDEITRSTKVRLGEGISGIAAKEGRSFLIDDNLKDKRIKSYLSRPYLSSSMVVPIKLENRVVGVMNLGALKTSQARFNTDNLEVMTKLIDLISVAVSRNN